MKKIILLLVCALCSAAIANAQADSSRTKSSTYSANPNYQSYPTRDMKRVSSSEIPASLRTTLQDSEYRGWENGTIYFNSITNEYSLQATPSSSGSTSSTSAAGTKSLSWYRFDKSGKRIPDTKPH